MLTQSSRRRHDLWIGRLTMFALAAIALATFVYGADGKTPIDRPARANSPHSTPIVAKALAAKGTGNEDAIRATAQAFVKAFNAGEAKAVADLWVSNGTVADEQGNVFKGRKAIEEQYAALFKAHPTARMHVAIRSIEFPSPTTAIEDGMTQVMSRDNLPPSASRYTAVHVQENGKWLMASVREWALPASSNFFRLQELDWLVGAWEAKTSGAVARCQIRWIANKSFLQRDSSVSRDGLLVSSGAQIVGWDPRSERIVSWSFDSSGGHGTGQWTPDPKGWRITSAGVTADGVPTSSLDYLVSVPGDENVFGFRSMDRKLGDAILPNIGEVVFDRVTPKNTTGRADRSAAAH